MEKKITVMKLFGVFLTPTCQKLDALEILDVIFCSRDCRSGAR